MVTNRKIVENYSQSRAKPPFPLGKGALLALPTLECFGAWVGFDVLFTSLIIAKPLFIEPVKRYFNKKKQALGTPALSEERMNLYFMSSILRTDEYPSVRIR